VGFVSGRGYWPGGGAVIKTDNDVWALICDAIRTGMAERGLDVVVQQSYQPTQQGVPTKNTIALHAIDGARYGFPEDECFYDADQDAVIRRQSYWLTRSYQVDALAIQNPATLGSPTAFDLLEAASYIMQNFSVVEYLRVNGIGILRVQPLRVSYFLDDKGRHEQKPSFDFTLSYRQEILSTAEPITKVTAEIYEV
jgi:hypothetical protein